MVFQARAIESSLKEKLVDSPICDEDADVEAEIKHRKILKATAQKLFDCVCSECEPTMEALRTALQVSQRLFFYYFFQPNILAKGAKEGFGF